mgnify:CR=1 FL=1|tara:strand:+ start:361 stop:594 length:234 start_codon:yes stop_codon:yes gene_type:complete
MQLSNQALGALMLALQNSLMNQTDIVPVLKEFSFVETDDGLVVENPPVVDMGATDTDDEGSAVFNAYIDAIEDPVNT